VRNLGLKTEITKPQQLIDEMKEAALNPKRFSKAKNFKHKINTMAKVIMRGTWRNTVGATEPDEQQVTIDSETGTATIDLTPSDNLDEHFSAEDNAFFAEIMQDIYRENAEKKRL